MNEPSVIVYIYGADIEHPSYSELIDFKIACENNNQPFILIPPPKISPDGNYIREPEISPESPDYDLGYLKNVLSKTLGDGKEFARRNYEVIIDTHGLHAHESDYYGHNSFLNKNNYPKTIDLFQVLFESNPNIKSCFKISCHSGAAISDFNSAIICAKIAGIKLPEKIEFIANARYFEDSYQRDSLSCILALTELARCGRVIDSNLVEDVYLSSFGENQSANKVPIVKKTFYTNKTNQEAVLYYEDLNEIAKSYYNFLKLNQSGFPLYEEILEKLNKDTVSCDATTPALKYGDYYAIKICFDESKNYTEFYKKIPFSAYGDFLNIANEYQDNKEKKFSEFDKVSFIARQPSFFTDIKMLRPAFSKEEFNNLIIMATKFSAEDDPEACFKNITIWKKYFNPIEVNDVLKKAAEESAIVDPLTCFANFDLWKNSTSQTQRNEILRNAISFSDDINIYLHKFINIWLPAFEDDKKSLETNLLKLKKDLGEESYISLIEKINKLKTKKQFNWLNEINFEIDNSTGYMQQAIDVARNLISYSENNFQQNIISSNNNLIQKKGCSL